MTSYQKKEIYKLLREYLILRDGERCLRCGKTETLAISHIFPRGSHRAMELEPDNLKFLCYYCHICWWHKNPIEAHEWLATAIPKPRLDKLKLMANTSHKVPEYKLLKLWLEAEIKKMKICTRN
jgi:5-methylcytosine-specific restriction endonuclease McrA